MTLPTSILAFVHLGISTTMLKILSLTLEYNGISWNGEISPFSDPEREWKITTLEPILPCPQRVNFFLNYCCNHLFML